MSDNYMRNIYDLINSEEVVYDNDDIIYLDEPEDELFYEYDELSWADDITYLDEPGDDEFDLDLGEGFIPLPQGDIYQEEVVVIDEKYILDEYEDDLVQNYTIPALEDSQEVEYTFDDIFTYLVDDDNQPIIDVENAESILHFQEEQELVEELKVTNLTEEDDKIAKAIAKEHLDMVSACENGIELFQEAQTPEDDTSWVDDEDVFGNNIDVIIAEDPNKEVVEEDYVDGSFQDWLAEQNK